MSSQSHQFSLTLWPLLVEFMLRAILIRRVHGSSLALHQGWSHSLIVPQSALMDTEKLGQERNLKGHVEWEEHTHLYSPRCEWFRLGQLDWSHWKPRADLVVAHSSIPCQHGDAKPFPAIHPQLRTMHRSHETLVSSRHNLQEGSEPTDGSV